MLPFKHTNFKRSEAQIGAGRYLLYMCFVNALRDQYIFYSGKLVHGL